MIVVPAGVKVHLAFDRTDMRKGLDGLAMLCVVRSWAALRKALSKRCLACGPAGGQLGRSDDLPEHYSYCGEEYESPVIGEELIVSGGDSAELLQLIEETLDEVSFLVECLVVRERCAAI